MSAATDHHNAFVGPIVQQITAPIVSGSGRPADVLVLLESVLTGVLMFFEAEPGEVMDALRKGVIARTAEVKARQKARVN